MRKHLLACALALGGAFAFNASAAQLVLLNGDAGTGLGLDISRRIVVDRHAGDISFESAPGSTTARIRLPTKR